MQQITVYGDSRNRTICVRGDIELTHWATICGEDDRQRRYAKARRFFRIVTGFAKTTPFNLARLHQAALKLKETRTPA